MLKEFEQKKAALRRELREIEERLENRARDIGGFLTGLVPTEKIRRLPFRSVVIALALGFASGITKIGRRRKRSGFKGFMKFGLTGLVLGELKRIAARKAIRYASDLADQKLRQRFDMERD